MKIAYRCKIEKQDDKSFLVKFPSFDEIHTEGQTYEEALFNAEEALNLTLEGWMEDRLSIPIPESIAYKEEALVSPSPRIQAALFVHFKEKDLYWGALAQAVLRTSKPEDWLSHEESMAFLKEIIDRKEKNT